MNTENINGSQPEKVPDTTSCVQETAAPTPPSPVVPVVTDAMRVAAVKAYAAIEGTCRPVAMREALAAALALATPPSDDVEQLRAEIARLNELSEARARIIEAIAGATGQAAMENLPLVDRLTAAEARERVLVEALKTMLEIAEEAEGYGDWLVKEIAKARAALEQVKPKETTHEG